VPRRLRLRRLLRQRLQHWLLLITSELLIRWLLLGELVLNIRILCWLLQLSQVLVRLPFVRRELLLHQVLL